MTEGSPIVPRLAWREGGFSDGARALADECAVALTYNGGTYAVMMATPHDLEDFAVGFSLNEGIVDSSADIRSLEVIQLIDGVELRMWLPAVAEARLRERRRHIAGPTGCGLCGIDSIAEAMRPAGVVGSGQSFSPPQLMSAVRAVAPLQKLNKQTHAIHAAAFWNQQKGIVALREDVGRHNALDKLAGALALGSVNATEGLVVLTSRVSVEMVQKTAAIGAPVMVAVSAPTALAVKTADAAGITLAAVARNDGFEIFTHPYRIGPGSAVHVA